MTSNKEEVDIIEMYGNDAICTKEKFISMHKVEQKGISEDEAIKKLQTYGYNEVKQAKPKKCYNYFLQSLITPFNCILLGIVAILIYTDVYLATNPNYANIIVIAILVTASTLLDFFEEYRSNKAAEKLRDKCDPADYKNV